MLIKPEIIGLVRKRDTHAKFIQTLVSDGFITAKPRRQFQSLEPIVLEKVGQLLFPN